jgi:PAS domain S-box-containing protein
MAVFAFSAWMLTLVFAAVVASWYGGLATLGLPLGVLLLGALTWVAVTFRLRQPLTATEPPPGALQAWSSALCQGISTPSLTIGHGVVEVANQAFLALLGYRDRSDQVVGLPFTNLLHPADHDLLVNMLVRARGPTSAGAEGSLRLVRADGGLVKMQMSLTPLQGVTGRFLLQLVPNAVNTEAPAQGDELTAVLDRLDLVMFKTDCEGRIGYVNRAWERLSGRSPAQSRGLRLSSVMHPEDRAQIDPPLLAIARGQIDPLGVECRLVNANGNVVWVMLRASAFTLPDGELVGVAGTITEISRRKQLEATLGSTRRYLNTLLANVPGMVYRGRNDRDWTMEFVSDGCFELTGYEPYELVEKSGVTFAALIHPLDREFVWTQVQKQLALHAPYHMSYRIIDARGQLRWVWEQGRGVFSSHGEFLAIEGFITDVSERRGAEEQARRRMWFEARTGMLGRALFDSLLAHVWQHSQHVGYPYAVFVIDLFDLATLGERIGGERAEQALDLQARRFSQVNGPGATVCYLGSNQFAVLATDFRTAGVTDPLPEISEVIPAASSIAQHMAEALSAPLTLGDETFSVAVAVGIAISDARYVGAAAVLEAARKAAGDAAALGPGRCEFADE